MLSLHVSLPPRVFPTLLLRYSFMSHSPPSLSLSSSLRLASLALLLNTHKKKYHGNDVTEENDWSVYLTAENLCFAGVLAGM